MHSDTDVVVACGGATSSESLDRTDLKLDQHDFLVGLTRRLKQPNRTEASTDARPRPKLVVLALAPGTVLTPLTLILTLILILTLTLVLALTLTLTLTRF